jgi:hypothetical protein
MTTDMLDRLKAAKAKADGGENDRANYAAYVADRVENGWPESDVAEYRAEVGRIMATGTEDEKTAAREFWAHKATANPETGINARIRASIAADKREAA